MEEIGPVRLPWPSPVLSPNHRGHWAPKAKAVRMARTYAAWLVKEQCSTKPGWDGASVSITFCPPNKRRRDRDNLIASLKAATDGIADALGIDDSRFETTYRMGDIVKGGAVIVTIKEGTTNV